MRTARMRRQVDHEAVVDHGGARDVVPAAADGERQLVLGGEADSGRDVVGVGAARDRGRALVDHAVPDAARGVVLGVIGCDDVAGQALGERGGEMGGRRRDGWAMLMRACLRGEGVPNREPPFGGPRDRLLRWRLAGDADRGGVALELAGAASIGRLHLGPQRPARHALVEPERQLRGHGLALAGQPGRLVQHLTAPRSEIRPPRGWIVISPAGTSPRVSRRSIARSLRQPCGWLQLSLSCAVSPASA